MKVTGSRDYPESLHDDGRHHPDLYRKGLEYISLGKRDKESMGIGKEGISETGWKKWIT